LKKVNRQEHLEDIYWNHQQQKQFQNGECLLRKAVNLSKMVVKNKADIKEMAKTKAGVRGFTMQEAKELDDAERTLRWNQKVETVNSAGRTATVVLIPTQLTIIKDELFAAISSIRILNEQKKSIANKRGTKMAQNVNGKIKAFVSKAKKLVSDYNNKVEAI
jgi:hypothetical protein